MADAVRNATSLLLLSFFLLQCLTNASSISNGADNPAPSGSAALALEGSGGKGPWCVAQPEATPEANIDYGCGGGIADCSAIQEGVPDNVAWHAAYAMNSYYYATGHEDINCYFAGTGVVIWNDPSYDGCVYPS